MPAFGLTAISTKKRHQGGRNEAGLYSVRLKGKEVYVGGSKDISQKYKVDQKSISHYALHGGKLKSKYDVVRID